MKKLTILGSTGSIGTQTLEVVRHFPQDFEVVALTCGSNVELLAEQVAEFKPKYVCVGNSKKKDLLKMMMPRDVKTKILVGDEGNQFCATIPEVDIVVAAMVGMRGLPSVLSAIREGKDIALANKETLVVGDTTFDIEMGKAAAPSSCRWQRRRK